MWTRRTFTSPGRAHLSAGGTTTTAWPAPVSSSSTTTPRTTPTTPTPSGATPATTSATTSSAATSPRITLDNLIVSSNLPLVETYQENGMSALGDSTRRAIFELLAE